MFPSESIVLPRPLGRVKKNTVYLALAFKFTTMPFVKIWIHVVWTTKNRIPLLHKGIRQEVFKHIHQNALEKGIYMDIVMDTQNMFTAFSGLKMTRLLAKCCN